MDTLGVVESRSIASGAELSDGMVKAASVELVRASTVCSGRFLIFVSGDREAVEASVAFAKGSDRPLTGAFVISNISPQVLEALKKSGQAGDAVALGLVESRNVSSGIVAADAAVKRADIQLLRLVAGQGIQGKSYFVFGGDVAAVEEAARAAKESLGQHHVDSVVIPRPDKAVVRALTGGAR